MLQAFRDQDLIDKDPDWQINDWTAVSSPYVHSSPTAGRHVKLTAANRLAQYFGRPHTHPTSGQPEGVPELHLVYRDGKKALDFDAVPYLTTAVWHSDVSAAILSHPLAIASL